MWLNLKVGVFYGAPVAAVLLAIVACVALLLRVRKGRLSRCRAALQALWTLLLPVAAVLLIGLTGEAAGYFSSTVSRYAWDAGRALGLMQGLLPLALYVASAIAVVLLLFWTALSLLRDAR